LSTVGHITVGHGEFDKPCDWSPIRPTVSPWACSFRTRALITFLRTGLLRKYTNKASCSVRGAKQWGVCAFVGPLNLSALQVPKDCSSTKVSSRGSSNFVGWRVRIILGLARRSRRGSKRRNKERGAEVVTRIQTKLFRVPQSAVPCSL